MNICQYTFVSDAYIKAAQTLVVDDYMGIMYALIIKICGHKILLHLLQLLSLIIAESYLCRKIFEDAHVAERWCIVVVGILNPFILQIAFLNEPYAFSISFVLLLLGCIYDGMRKGFSYQTIIWGLLFEGILILFDPINVYACFFVLFAGLFFLKKEGLKKKLIVSSVMAIWLLLISALDTNIHTISTYGRVENSVSYTMFQRTAWPSTMELVGLGYDVDIDNIQYEILLREAMFTSEKMETVIGPFLSDVYGDRTDAIFREAAIDLFARGKKIAIKSFAEDFAKYIFPVQGTFCEICLIDQNPVTANNLSDFSRKLPLFSKLYIIGYSFFISLIFILAFLLAITSKRQKEKTGTGYALTFICIMYALLLTIIRVRGFDYRAAGLQTVIFSFLTFYLYRFTEEKQHDSF